MTDWDGFALPKEGTTIKTKAEWDAWHRDPANNQCFDCGSWVGDHAEAHHKEERGMGGGSRDDSDENLMPLCHDCHMRRHAGLEPDTIMSKLKRRCGDG